MDIYRGILELPQGKIREHNKQTVFCSWMILDCEQTKSSKLKPSRNFQIQKFVNLLTVKNFSQ